MTEKFPKSHTEKIERQTKSTGGVTTAILTPDDKTEGLEEINYGSAPGSSAIMSGAESSVWTSDDYGFEETRLQQDSSNTELNGVVEVSSRALDIAAKPADIIKMQTNKKSKLGFFKKRSPVAKRVVSNAEMTENLIPSEEEDKTKTSPPNARSRSKFTSGLFKLVSFRKTRTTNKYQSRSPAKQERVDKTSQYKSPIKKLSTEILTSVVSSNKQRLMILLPNEEDELSTEEEMGEKCTRSHKNTSPSKEKSRVQADSVQNKYSEFTSQASECSVKSKRSLKFTLGKFNQLALIEIPLAKQSSSTDVKSDASSANSSAFSLVRKGIKKMDVSGKLRKSPKRAEGTRLLQEDKSAGTKSMQGEDEFSEERSLNETYVFRKTAWKPENPAQEGGLLAEDVITYVSSTEKDTTPTEMSTVSNSLSLIRAKSKSQQSRHRTLDSLSKVSSFEEEIEGSTGIEVDVRSQLQTQTNASDFEMVENSEDVFDSPKHKVSSGKESDDETSE